MDNQNLYVIVSGQLVGNDMRILVVSVIVAFFSKKSFFH